MSFIKKVLEKTQGWPIRSFYAGTGTILALHRVLPATKKTRLRNDGLEITPEKLEHLINFFKKRNYDFLGIDELRERLRSKATKKFVIFTFDDGYVDNFEVAFPLLNSYGVPFTIYLTNNYIKREQQIWWYSMENLLISSEELKFSFKDKDYYFETKQEGQKQIAFNELRKLIIAQDLEGLKEVMDIVFKTSISGSDKSENPKTLSIHNLKELSKNTLVTLGAHTFNHLALNKLSRNEFVFEVEQSKKELEKMIGVNIRHFSYPFGSRQEVGPREFAWVKELGFETAVTGRPGNIHKVHKNHMTALPRLYISENKTDMEIDKFITGVTPCLTGIRKRVMVD